MPTKEQNFVVDIEMLVIEPEVFQQIILLDLFDGVARHMAGDWGVVDDVDQRANDVALVTGRRILSAYTDRFGSRFWIVTKADRSETSVLVRGDD